MDEPEHTIEMQDICTIQIAFPVDTDEQAIEYKKKISEILSNIPNLRIDFSLASMPKRLKRNAS
ncbi:unnamed protein product [marine sediment metagenome]|uniref:Uncharacterized protein n=1 Tax=marine sediment metagenome TaxID=412755 RepID=X1ULB2_9ZZZZ